jgi:hypothetical protein
MEAQDAERRREQREGRVDEADAHDRQLERR